MSALSQFQHDTGSWASKTFPKSNRGTICSHFREEAREFAGGYNDYGVNYIEPSHDPEEAADCLLLLLHHAHIEGYDLLDYAIEKLAKNQQRDWLTEPTEGGHFKHKKES